MPPKRSGGTKGRNAPSKAIGSNSRGQKPNPQGGDNIPPELKISTQYLRFKRLANSLAKELEPYGLSISAIGKAIAAYQANHRTFAVDEAIVRLYGEFVSASEAWSEFRSIFRAQDDARIISSQSVQGMLASLEEEENTDANGALE